MSFETDPKYRQAAYEEFMLMEELRRGAEEPYTPTRMQHIQDQLDLARGKKEHAKAIWLSRFGGVDGDA